MIPDEPARPWYREPYVWLLITFPLAAVIGGILTIVIAVRSNDGLVVDDYYRRGLEINRTLARDRVAREYGLHADLQYAPGDTQLRLIVSANGDFLYPETIKLSFLNAARAGLDRELTLTRYDDTVYTGPAPELSMGKWHLLIEGEEWRLLDVIFVP